MELLIFIVLLVFGGSIIQAVLNAGNSAVRMAQGKEPLYSGPLQSKLEREDVDGETMFRVMFRGDVPVTRNQSLAISVVLKDVTDYEEEKIRWPVISFLEELQEKDTLCFEYRQNVEAAPNSVWTDWVQAAPVFPSMLQTPYKGARKIEVDIVFFTDDGNASYDRGYLPEGSEILAVLTESFAFNFKETGFREESENQKEGSELAIKVALAVAMADGSLDDSEGEVIQTWMRKNLDMMSESQQEDMRPRLNAALKEGYQDAQNGTLLLSPLCERIAEIATAKSKYDTIDLCMDVMAADGVAEESELLVIDSIASAIGLDMAEINRIKEERMVSSNLQATSGNAFAILGIDESMTKREKQKQLRSEFKKWNDRLTSLPAGEERENAQRMLDLVAEAKAKVDAE